MKEEKNRVSHLADLARLDLDADEQKRQEKEFQEVINFVGEIDSVPVSPVAESSLHSTISGVSNVFRDDVVIPSSLADELIELAPDKKGRLIKVPKVF